MVLVGLDEVVVAGVGVGRGERAGDDHGEVQNGGWGVGLRIRGKTKFQEIGSVYQAYN